MTLRRRDRRVQILLLLTTWLAVGHRMADSGLAAENAAAPAGASYLGPCALAVSADGRVLYAACADARQVAWIDVPAGRVTRRVDVPAEPASLNLTPDGTKLVVVCGAPRSTVLILDAASGRTLSSIPAGHTAAGSAISPDGSRLYVCNRFDNDVSIIDLPNSREVCRVPADREPIAVAVTLDGRSVLVANHVPNRRTDAEFTGDISAVVTVVDSQTCRTSSIALPHGANGVRGLCVLPDGQHALAIHLLSNFQMVPFRVDNGWINTNVVSILDVAQGKCLRTIGLDDFDRGRGSPWDVICLAEGRTVCVSHFGTHELSLIETEELLGDVARRTMMPMMGVWPIYPSLGGSLWRRVALPGKGPQGLAVAGSKIFAAEYFSDTVVEVDVAGADQPDPRTIALGPAPRPTTQRWGQMLFHDATLCYQQWQSCASCHPDARVDGLTWDLMNDGVGNPKSTKSMLWSHRTPPAMAASVRETAEDAVRAGLTHILFAYRPEEEAAAIDVYLQSLQPIPSPYLVDGRLSPAAERGRQLFHAEHVNCARCHPAPLYTDLKAHNVGSQSPQERNDRFDTPTLVEVWRTAPYLHDGRYRTVRELLAEGRHGLRRIGEIGLSDQELDDLVAFVLSL